MPEKDFCSCKLRNGTFIDISLAISTLKAWEKSIHARFLEADVIVLVKERIDEMDYGQNSECLLENKNGVEGKYFDNAFTNSVKLDIA